ncbi:hypothetical protein HHK36_002715 [Tetracentron sinense]|uniref:Uncharacterized protein n=1 Tax=Tetracentron sinense TaxID=13715 RepID=A0A835DN56_TETSI|nr:hypothetical protein HHK36_002715 [Tetracentron sinense]
MAYVSSACFAEAMLGSVVKSFGSLGEQGTTIQSSPPLASPGQGNATPLIHSARNSTETQMKSTCFGTLKWQTLENCIGHSNARKALRIEDVFRISQMRRLRVL